MKLRRFQLMPVIQLKMIDKVAALAAADDDISAVLMYGSFIKGEGDQYSDIEFYIFHRREPDHRAWVAQIQPLLIFFQNEFGTEVAIFDNLIRGEFHFHPAEGIDVVKSWEGLTSFEYAGQMILADKDGRLKNILDSIDQARPRHGDAENIEWLAMSLINNLLMVKNVLKRGEAAHAQQAFQYIQKYLLWLIRLAAGADNHWESPTKGLEREIPAQWYDSYAACVPALSREKLAGCLTASATLAGELFRRLGVSDGVREVLWSITEDELNFLRITAGSDPLFEPALDLYQNSFPVHEQRLPESQRIMVRNPAYHFEAILQGRQLAGIICYWDNGLFSYIEHFAVNPDLRGRSLGSRILTEFCDNHSQVILEIDPTIDEVSNRREKFYCRLGFKRNDFQHQHPPYRSGLPPHALIVMSRPGHLSQVEYDSFKNYLEHTVMSDCSGKGGGL
ncbi:hypothetical protein C4J81_03095 [Deltaproteobacteria bacterium Smac51]|nr:hypothetical protein C4J81_03095 [Deltaproteobacteria bacterium Smac51]